MDINAYATLLNEMATSDRLASSSGQDDVRETITKAGEKGVMELKGAEKIGAEKLSKYVRGKGEEAYEYASNKINNVYDNITGKISNYIQDTQNTVSEQVEGLSGRLGEAQDAIELDHLSAPEELTGVQQYLNEVSPQRLIMNEQGQLQTHDEIEAENQDISELGQLQHETPTAVQSGEVAEGAEIGATTAEEGAEIGAETALDLDPITMLIGAGLLIGSLFVHPNKNKPYTAPHVNISHQFGVGQ